MLQPSRCLVPLTVAVLAACSGDLDTASIVGNDPLATEVASARAVRDAPVSTSRSVERRIEASLLALAGEADARMRTRRSDVALQGVWWTGQVEGRTMGGFVYFEDRGNKRLPVQWVPGDPRRNGRTDIGYAVGVPVAGAPQMAPPGLDVGSVEAAVDRAMATWGSQRCSRRLTISKGTYFDWLVFDADILHAWFQPLDPGVLGVTLPYVFVDGEGNPTDVDGDGAMDYAFAEIFYNSSSTWGIDGSIDVETVALHEAGHGLGQAHFGAAFETVANGKIHFAPRSVMNAAYSGVQQSLTGTDRGGHCGLYGSWPNG